MTTNCECVSCPDCGGTGTVWFDIFGHYQGNSRTDDLDELEMCETCGGSGTTQVCAECQMARELDEEKL